MIRPITSLLRRIVRRIDKVKVLRDLILIIFVLLFAYLAPTLSELLNAGNWDEFNRIFQDNQLLPYIVALPFVVLGLMLLFIRTIDKWEDDKAEKRHQALLEAIQSNSLLLQGLINEIRQERNERNNKSQ